MDSQKYTSEQTKDIMLMRATIRLQKILQDYRELSGIIPKKPDTSNTEDNRQKYLNAELKLNLNIKRKQNSEIRNIKMSLKKNLPNQNGATRRNVCNVACLFSNKASTKGRNTVQNSNKSNIDKESTQTHFIKSFEESTSDCFLSLPRNIRASSNDKEENLKILRTKLRKNKFFAHCYDPNLERQYRGVYTPNCKIDDEIDENFAQK